MTPHFNGHTQPLQVSAQRVELLFNDNSRATLHNVLCHGSADRYLRAVPHAAGEHVVDLRRLAHQLGEDLCTAESRDVPYLIATTLRLKYPSAEAFMNAVMEHRMRTLEMAE